MTLQFENFPNPPIQEAIVDFRVAFAAVPPKEEIGKLVPLLANRYPTSKDLMRMNATFEFNEGGGSANQQTNFGGLRFESTNDNFVFQAHVDGFTLSKLKPYRNWDELVGEARSLWAIYCEVLKPITIERIACRYINRIEINDRQLNFDDYLTAAPKVPENLPQGVSKFFSQIEVPAASESATVVVTQALEGVSSDSLAVLLDLDVSKIKSYTVNENQWWSELDRLRTLKNQFFFESITEKSKVLFR
jgi:uncharacterized protein (TIGR04255 family)